MKPEDLCSRIECWNDAIASSDRTIIECNGIGKVVDRGVDGGVYLDLASNARGLKEELILQLAELRRARGETLWTVVRDVERRSPSPPWIT